MNTLKSRGGEYFSPALCCLLLALAALLGLPGEVKADHPDSSSVSAVLGEKPPELEGVAVQVKDTQGPQFLIENNTEKTLEVYNAEGVPFLRVGPDGVEANRKAKTFYETYGPEGIIVAEEARKTTAEEARADPEWVRISDRRSWGWFDHRLETEDVDVPEEISRGGETADFGGWQVPVRLGDSETALEGDYRYEPDATGTYIASLTAGLESSEVNAQLSQGFGGATALLLQNEDEEPVTVLDRSGEPAIRIGPDEVKVNTSSAVGREADRSAASTGGGGASGSAEPEWKTVSGGSSFTWQDPRLRPPDDQGASAEETQWEIPVEIAGEEQRLRGEFEWKSLGEETSSDESTAGSDDSGHDHSSHDHAEDGSSRGGESGEADSAAFSPVSAVSAATIVPVAGLVIAASAGGALLYSRWRGSR